nr:hypothetical protein [Rhodoferax sp.]
MLKAFQLTCLIAILSLTGCAQELQKLNTDLKTLNQALAGNGSSNAGSTTAPNSPVLAQRVETSSSTATQLIVPSDKSTADALDAALPTLKKVVAIHQCIKTSDGIRLLNFHAVPGKENSITPYWMNDYPNAKMRYHDKNKCVSVRAIDQVTLLALNTLRVRVIYFAEDSGEAANFLFQFKKVDDGTWKLDQINGV